MLKKLGQCLGLASMILVMSYGDLLGGGYDARMHVPFALKGIVWAQLTDIFLLGLLLFAVIAPLSRTRLYPWVKLFLAITVLPYLILLRNAVKARKHWFIIMIFRLQQQSALGMPTQSFICVSKKSNCQRQHKLN